MKDVIAWTLAVVFTTAGSLLAGSSVLCVGSDGHADLEIALGACCVAESPVPSDAAGHTSALGDPCGGCADIELDSKPLIKQKHQLEPPHQAEVIGTTVASCLVSEWSGAVSDELSAPPDLEVIATVVLLT